MLDSIRNNVAWKAIPIAAFLAGTAHLVFNLVFMPLLLDVNGLLLVRYFGSLVLGEEVLINPGVSVWVVGLIVHYVISLVLTLVIAIVVHRWGLLVGIVGGAILGLAFYGINLYAMTVFFEWFFAVNNGVLAASHIVFGAVAGGVYETLDRYDIPLGEEEPTHAT